VDSDEHVDVKLTNGTLTADRLHITDSGAVIRFEGNVVMNLTNLDGADGPVAKAETPEPAAAPARRPRQPKSTNAATNAK
jgi:lipopolysaccharide export system protein LptC